MTDQLRSELPVWRVEAHPVTVRTWEPFGWLPRADTDPTDGEHTLHFAWDDAHLNTIEHTTDEIDATERGLRCAVLYRHETHTQVLTPLDVASVIAVAPSDRTFDDPGDLETIRAFVLEPGETVVLHQGTWHWGPFPIRGASSVRLLNVQGRRYAEDNASVDPTARTQRVVEIVSL
jgi:ureidoglycolate hydrolase